MRVFVGNDAMISPYLTFYVCTYHMYCTYILDNLTGLLGIL